MTIVLGWGGERVRGGRMDLLNGGWGERGKGGKGERG